MSTKIKYYTNKRTGTTTASYKNVLISSYPTLAKAEELAPIRLEYLRKNSNDVIKKILSS